MPMKVWDWIVLKSFFFRHPIRYLSGRKRLNSLEDNKYYVICPFGIGDFCFAVKAMNIKYPDKKITYITRTPEKNLSSQFGDIEIIGDTKLCKELLEQIEFYSKYSKSNYFYANFTKEKGIWKYYKIENKTNFWDDLLKYVYDLPVGSLRNCYRSATGTSRTVLSAEDVVLFSNANTVNMVSTDFWEELADVLKNKGYNVYSNVVKDDDVIPGTIPLKLSLDEICIAVEKSAGCISLRSGICDLLAMNSTAKVFSVCPSPFWYKYGDIGYFRDFDTYNFLYESKEDMIETLSIYF